MLFRYAIYDSCVWSKLMKARRTQHCNVHTSVCNKIKTSLRNRVNSKNVKFTITFKKQGIFFRYGAMLQIFTSIEVQLLKLLRKDIG